MFEVVLYLLNGGQDTKLLPRFLGSVLRREFSVIELHLRTVHK